MRGWNKGTQTLADLGTLAMLDQSREAKVVLTRSGTKTVLDQHDFLPRFLSCARQAASSSSSLLPAPTFVFALLCHPATVFPSLDIAEIIGAVLKKNGRIEWMVKGMEGIPLAANRTYFTGLYGALLETNMRFLLIAIQFGYCWFPPCSRTTYHNCSGVPKKCPDNAVVDAIKLILLIYNNFNIVKKVVKRLVWVKPTLSCLPTNTELIFNKLVLIKSIQKS